MKENKSNKKILIVIGLVLLLILLIYSLLNINKFNKAEKALPFQDNIQEQVHNTINNIEVPQKDTLSNNEVESEENYSDTASTNSSINTKIEMGSFNCSPLNYNPKILSKPDPNSIHKDFEGTEVGLGCSIIANKKITNEKGVFLVGDFYSSRGTKSENGPFYIIYSEWQCFN